MSSKLDSVEALQNLIFEKLVAKVPFKLIFSKRKRNTFPVSVIHVQPVIIQNDIQLKCVLRYDTKDETINELWPDFSKKMTAWLHEDFFNVDVLFPEESYHLLQNKKGYLTILHKNIKNILPNNFAHDREKKNYIQSDAIYFKELGLISGNGLVFSKGQKKYNQVNKYIEVLSHLLKDEKPSGKFTIADMGSGKAYLTFALYDYLTLQLGWDVTIKGYENRPDLVSKCNQIADKMGWDNLRFFNHSIHEAPKEKTDMVIALHACDIATDMAISFGVECKAKYIVLAPCCQKQIRQNIKINNVLSPILTHGILLERQAEILTDGMRALLLQYKGYQTKVFEFISLEHTSKNVMITASKGNANIDALEQFNRIKKDFGITYHYLEKLLSL
ncbi:MAG: SAM-dependent methyltransferase [Saprospiraceae bacterium]